VILGLRDQAVKSTDGLLNLLDESAIGRETTLTVLRDNRELSLLVRPREQPTE
jgi:S1-C subfamily serine protease